MLLTYDEFTELGFKLDEKKFEELAPFAEIHLNIATRRYYEFNDFETDHEFRKRAYKNAIAFQILFMDREGILTADDVANKPSSISQSIGGTSVSKSFAKNTSSGETNGSGVSALSVEALNQLSGTGLMYRGIDYNAGNR